MLPTKNSPGDDLTFPEIMNEAAKSAMRGGTAGAAAMGAIVASLMWLRTTVSVPRASEKRNQQGPLYCSA